MALKKSDLYSSLWKSCDELRGGMDASQYKDYVLSLLFVKYVSDKYAGKDDGLIVIPDGASFQDMVALKGKSDVGDQINKIIDKILKENTLQGMISIPDFNDEDKLGKGKDMVDRLTNLIGIFENSNLNFSSNRADGDDILGDAYEYLMRHFATESGKSKGQFYTPAEVSRILAKVIGVEHATSSSQTVYDPTCGSGSLLLKVADEAHKTKISLYGQENDNATKSLAVMNMWLHGYPECEIWKDNTLSSPHFKETDGSLKRFDFVVANPPFSQKNWNNGFDAIHDIYKRFEGFGIPPEKNGDYAFLLHIIRSLKSTGKGAVILPHGVLFRGNTESEIRKNIITRGYIKGIIGLPANLFYGTGIPACIIVLDKEQAEHRKGIFMINASKGFMKDGNKNRLRDQDLHKIVDIFRKQLEIPKYSRMVTLQEIEKNDYNLNISRYIDIQKVEDLQDLTAHLQGGIPESDINDLQKYRTAYSEIKNILFKKDSKPGYYQISVEKDLIKQTIYSHPQFIKYRGELDKIFDDWKKQEIGNMKSIKETTKPRLRIRELGESLLAHYTDKPLIDKYAMYQHLMNYREEVMKDDIYMIIEGGWKAELEQVIDAKGKEKKGEFSCNLVPLDLVINHYFSQEKANLEKLEQNIESVQNSMNEMIEEHGGDEGLLVEVINEKGKISGKDLMTRIKQIKSNTDDQEELKILKEYEKLVDQESDLKGQYKTTYAELYKKVYRKFPELTTDEIKELIVEDKWINMIQSRLQSEIDAISQRLTQRIKDLISRYESPLSTINIPISENETSLQRVFEELLNGKKRLPGFTDERKTIKLGDISEFYKGKGLSKDVLVEGGKHKCIHYGELFTKYNAEIEKIYSNTDEEGSFVLSKSNDVLMPTSDVTPNGLATASCIKENGIILGGDILIIRTSEKVLDGTYLSYCILKDKPQIMQLVSGTTVFHLYASDMKNFEFKLPSIEEQKAIIDTIKSVDKEISLLDQKREKYIQLKTSIMQGLLS